MPFARGQMEDDAIDRIDALVSLARSAREDNVDDVLRTVVDTVHSTAGFEMVVFNRYRPAWDDYEVTLVLGPPETQSLLHTRKSRTLFEDQLLVSEYEVQPGMYFLPSSADVWEDLDGYVVPTAARPTRPGEWDPEDALLVQLRDSKGEPLGILSIDEPRSGRVPDASALRLLRAICSHAEQSLENAQTTASTERHRHQMAQLLRASTRLSECETHAEVFATASEALVPDLGFERMAIYRGTGAGPLTLASTTFAEPVIADALGSKVLDLFHDATSELGGCWIVPASQVHGASQGVRSKRNGMGQFCWSDDVLLVPALDAEGAPRLVFAIEDPVNHLRPTETECELLRLLVEQTDAALERVTFRTRLEHLVDHDASTGLLNRRVLSRIPSEAKATLMICDLDHFKSVNDTYGHEVGDEVISRFANLLRSLSRGDDLAVRLGGDEFMMYLPGTSAHHARTVAERMRVGLPPLMAPLVSSEMTLSIGLTQVEAGEHIADAMRRADSALYAAKKNGRNQIAVA